VAQLTAAIANVMKDIDTVAKRGENSLHRYRYATMGDILKEVTPLLGRHGPAIFQSETGRAMFDGENVIAIEYSFTIAHESGETWPQPLRQSGVSKCRDSKGRWDDKSLNKCHAAARKYFLLSLFQIPTGEEDDVDRGENDGRRVGKTLPKKDSREIYVKLQGEIRNMSAIDELRQWGENARERIAVMAEDWQDILRLQYAEKLVELRQFPRKVTASTHDTDGVIWEENGERPATAEDAAAVRGTSNVVRLGRGTRLRRARPARARSRRLAAACRAARRPVDPRKVRGAHRLAVLEVRALSPQPQRRRSGGGGVEP
jgi:hypothetical protein